MKRLAQPQPTFNLGFKTVADQIPDIVGQPLLSEHYGAKGDSLQQTFKGLLVWRKADNCTAFTNGYITWINGLYGIQSRLNTDRFDWEKSGTPPASPKVTGAWSQVGSPPGTAANVTNLTTLEWQPCWRTNLMPIPAPYFRSGQALPGNAPNQQRVHAGRCEGELEG